MLDGFDAEGSYDGTNASIRPALQAGMGISQGIENPDTNVYKPFVYPGSLNAVDPKCDLSAPPDADLSTMLPEEKLKELFSSR